MIQLIVAALEETPDAATAESTGAVVSFVTVTEMAGEVVEMPAVFLAIAVRR